MPLADARAELVRRFLRVYGPATPTQLASWARPRRPRETALRGNRGRAPRLRSRGGGGSCPPRTSTGCAPPAASGVRLLGGHDPYVAQPDRASLVAADDAVRKKLFPPVGRPGVVLADGRADRVLARAQQGDVLELIVEWLARPGRRRRRGIRHRLPPRLRSSARALSRF